MRQTHPTTYELTSSSTDSRTDPELQRLLESTWSERHDAGVGFRYRLHIERERIAEGKFNFLILVSSFWASLFPQAC